MINKNPSNLFYTGTQEGFSIQMHFNVLLTTRITKLFPKKKEKKMKERKACMKFTYCLMHSGIDTYSIGTSSARSARLYTNFIFWLNLELEN